MKKVYICKKCGNVVAASGNAVMTCQKCGSRMEETSLTDQEWLGMSNEQRRDVFRNTNRPKTQPSDNISHHESSGHPQMPNVSVPSDASYAVPVNRSTAGGTGIYANIGGKICTLAKVIAWLGICLSVLVGIITIAGTGCTTAQYGAYIGSSASGQLVGYSLVFGILFAGIGSLLSWTGGMVLYGFGELILRVNEIAENTRK